MSRTRAVVLEKKGTQLTVLSSDGAFQKLHYKGTVEVGEEIQIPAVQKVPIWRMGASVAAIFLMIFMGVFGWNAFQPRTAVAMLSMDINPSLQLTLDQKGRVLGLESLNPDAEQLLSGLSLKGEPWEKALSRIVEQSVNLHYLNSEHPWILVGYSPMKSEQNVSPDEINADVITKQVEESAKEKGVSPQVAVYKLTAEEKVQAQETGLTLGEYALANTAKKAGVQIQPEAIKKTDERIRLLEKPEIQEQMKKEPKVKLNTMKSLPASQGSKVENGQDIQPKVSEPSDGYERDDSKNNENKAWNKKNAVSFPGQSFNYDWDSNRGKSQGGNDRSKDKAGDKSITKNNEKNDSSKDYRDNNKDNSKDRNNHD
jgi:hypothetical protein